MSSPRCRAGVPPEPAGALTVNELERKKQLARYATFVTTPDERDDQGNPLVPRPDDEQSVYGPGATVLLYPGEDVKFAEPGDVGGSYEPFQYRTLLQICAALGIPYGRIVVGPDQGDLCQLARRAPRLPPGGRGVSARGAGLSVPAPGVGAVDGRRGARRRGADQRPIVQSPAGRLAGDAGDHPARPLGRSAEGSPGDQARARRPGHGAAGRASKPKATTSRPSIAASPKPPRCADNTTFPIPLPAGPRRSGPTAATESEAPTGATGEAA